MSYYFAKTLSCSFDEAVERTTEALKKAGFGIITEIDVKGTFKQKRDVDFRNYRIRGACNPRMAYDELAIADKVGTMLPCNVILQDAGEGRTEVAAIDPVASMQAVANPKLEAPARKIQAQLKQVIEGL